ncbi:MAG: hypothetical protein IJY25_02325 [Bacilli bacterium]|nr:hypothetical protein [Clostridia bacterium]MBQ9071975.1 hypothetical protein [Bacilli bacterium]
MDKIFKELEDAIVKSLNNKNKTPLTEEKLKISEEFHNKYFDKMYDKKVRVVLKNGQEIIGYYNDEFYEDCAIFVNYEVIKISDIETMELIGE